MAEADQESPSEVEAREAVADLLDRPDIPEVFLRILNPKKRAFLLALCMTPNVSVACRVAGISRPTPYNWEKERNADYDEAYAAAQSLGIKAAEAEAWKRATDGTIEDVYGALGNNQGSGVVGQRRVKSDTMLIFMLKGALPQKYRDNVSHTGANGGPIEFTLNLTRPNEGIAPREPDITITKEGKLIE